LCSRCAAAGTYSSWRLASNSSNMLRHSILVWAYCAAFMVAEESNCAVALWVLGRAYNGVVIVCVGTL
jgi:hypothetical protein